MHRFGIPNTSFPVASFFVISGESRFISVLHTKIRYGSDCQRNTNKICGMKISILQKTSAENLSPLYWERMKRIRSTGC